jgi:hypothetical protein
VSNSTSGLFALSEIYFTVYICHSSKKIVRAVLERAKFYYALSVCNEDSIFEDLLVSFYFKDYMRLA